MTYQVSQQKLIYVFAIPELPSHDGLLKIGETTFTDDDLEAAAHKRIKQFTNAAGIPHKLLHTELAVDNFGKNFSDRDVHRVLERSGYKKVTLEGTTAREWFRVDLPTVKRAIDAVRQGESFIRVTLEKVREEVILRPEQEAAVSKTVRYFAHGREFLWNAKMRFGKTLCALEVVRRMNFARTLIITHRPVVNAGWFEDFGKIFGGVKNFSYGSKVKGATIEGLLAGKKNFVYFASVQDLRGSQTVGGKYNKNSDLLKALWDLVIVDEAHEGLNTELGKDVMKLLVKPHSKVLKLSGTPFNIIDDFDEAGVFTWDYVMEQRAKENWSTEHGDDHNPYGDMPKMKILTYDLGDILQKFYLDDDEELAFSFREFFRTDGESFVHEDDVKRFLDLLVTADGHDYPFSRAEWREQFRHTFWLVPGVEAGRALSKLLKRHKTFGQFEIVNVAGDGDLDDRRGNALDKVKAAIDKHEYTITLSCGKLTAGVTVPEWTAVFMLTGSDSPDYKTSAMSYLQTIFRVQSPCKFGDRVKTECYVFDFAPDRTLRVIADAANVSARAGKTSDNRETLADFVKFCPVIAYEGSRMNHINADNLMQKLKRAYAERVVRNGFEDNYLYNDELLNLTDLDLANIADLGRIIGATKAQAKTADIIVNAQGLTKTELNRLAKELRRTPTAEEIDARNRRKIRNSAISILRGISIRMPLLIYGADVPFDKDITIDEFADLIDEDSWAEFMPRGVTKEKFANVIRFYERDVFIQSGHIVRKRAKAADSLPPTERVQKIADLFAVFKNPDKETVLTPWRVVNLHLESVFAESFFAADKHILEINSKTGLYALLIACKIYRARFAKAGERVNAKKRRRLWKKTLRENIFVICKTPMARTIVQRTLLGYRDGTVNARCFDDLINLLKNKPDEFVARVKSKSFWSKGDGKMFFDAVVGNPPYQTAGSGTGNFAAPVYHEFIKAAYNAKLTKHASLIHPARFLSNAGAIPGDFTEKFLQNTHVRVVKYYPNSRDAFPTSDIKGGVVITEFDAEKTFEPIDVFIPFDELRGIYQKVVVDNEDFQPLSGIIFGQTAYRLTKKFHEDNPDAVNEISKGHANDFSTVLMKRFSNLFFDNKPSDEHEYIQVYGLVSGYRFCKWFRSDWVTHPEPLNKWKVLVPTANGTGAIGEVLSTPLVGLPLVGSTETFISVGAFDTEAEARACIAYIKGKFCRALLGVLKVTQHNTPDKWRCVPLQDFTAASDIDWSASLPEIDAQLYRKYGLSDAEIAFIETHVKEMS